MERRSPWPSSETERHWHSSESVSSWSLDRLTPSILQQLVHHRSCLSLSSLSIARSLCAHRVVHLPHLLSFFLLNPLFYSNPLFRHSPAALFVRTRALCAGSPVPPSSITCSPPSLLSLSLCRFSRVLPLFASGWNRIESNGNEQSLIEFDLTDVLLWESNCFSCERTCGLV